MCKQDRLLDIERDIYYQNKIALRLATRETIGEACDHSLCPLQEDWRQTVYSATDR